MKQGNTKRSVSGTAALILLAVFAAGILSVLLTGADVYSRLTRRNTEGYDARTSVQYVSGKVRQASSSAAITVGSFGESDCLVITEEIDGNEYETRIYCYDGWLMELFSAAGSGLEPVDGSKLLPAERFSVTEEDGLLTVTITDSEGGEDTVFLHPRGGKAAKK